MTARKIVYIPNETVHLSLDNHVHCIGTETDSLDNLIQWTPRKKYRQPYGQAWYPEDSLETRMHNLNILLNNMDSHPDSQSDSLDTRKIQTDCLDFYAADLDSLSVSLGIQTINLDSRSDSLDGVG